MVAPVRRHARTDAPASAEPAQPAPEHPLAWLKAHMTAAAWTAWIEPLGLGEDDGVPIVFAPSVLVMEQAREICGPMMRRRYGPCAWAVRS